MLSNKIISRIVINEEMYKELCSGEIVKINPDNVHEYQLIFMSEIVERLKEKYE